MIEPKSKMKKSPDLADAFVLTFASTASIAMGGDGTRRDWKTPLRRVLRGVV